jgi:acylphosphatase
MMKRLEATVYGHVQGVFFRDTTRSEAQQLQITGWVRNQRDGTVRVVAEGEEDALQQFLDYLQQGPPAARVARVETDWLPAQNDFSSFRVRR